jgi:hypothetical protein
MDGTEVKNNGDRQCKMKMYLEDRWFSLLKNSFPMVYYTCRNSNIVVAKCKRKIYSRSATTDHVG